MTASRKFLQFVAPRLPPQAIRDCANRSESGKETNMQKLRRMLVIGLVLVAVPAMNAKEGADQYPNGAENWFAGLAPPPGFYFVNYLGYYTGQLKNASGHSVVLNGTTPLVEATFDAFRFIEITHVRFLGANYGMHAIIPVADQSMNLGGRASAFGVGDIIVDPLVLAWHREHLHAVAGVDMILPTGSYTQTDPRISVGSHYYSFEPVLALSYMPQGGWETSAKLMYNLKTTNPATNYHSGQEFHVDYAAGRHFGGWMTGATGYALMQATDDTINGQTVAAAPGVFGAGRRGQVVAIGPSLGYSSRHHMTFIAQWQHEMAVQNRFGGDKMWFKMIIPTAGIFHRKH